MSSQLRVAVLISLVVASSACSDGGAARAPDALNMMDRSPDMAGTSVASTDASEHTNAGSSASASDPGAAAANASAGEASAAGRGVDDEGAAGTLAATDAGLIADGSSLPGDDWEELVAGDWQLEPGQETYICLRRTLDEDVVVGGFNPISPLGTHHTTLTTGAPTGEDGTAECSGLLSSGEIGLWASGVSSPAYDFPAGVGMQLHAGDQVNLSLHLFNTTEQTLSGRSGVSFHRRDAAGIEHWADGSLMGPVDLFVPAMQATRIVGGCTFDHEATVLAMLPHMHELGRHMKIVAERAGRSELVLHDGDFEFQDQGLVIVPEGTTLQAGDRMRIECSYDNDTARDVGFGESTKDEMCFAAVVRYPASAQPACIL